MGQEHRLRSPQIQCSNVEAVPHSFYSNRTRYIKTPGRQVVARRGNINYWSQMDASLLNPPIGGK